MKRKSFGYAKWGYLFCLPFVLAFLIFSLYPIIFTGIIGFTDFKGMGRTDFSFLENPLENFQNVLSNPSFQKAFVNTVKIWLYNFIPQIGLALLLTAWFTDKRNRIDHSYQLLFYIISYCLLLLLLISTTLDYYF